MLRTGFCAGSVVQIGKTSGNGDAIERQWLKPVAFLFPNVVV